MLEKSKDSTSNITNITSELSIEGNTPIEPSLGKPIRMPACSLKFFVQSTRLRKLKKSPLMYYLCSQRCPRKEEIFVPYNILPLDAAGASQPIMQLEEIKAAVIALKNTRGLHWPSSFKTQRQKLGDMDLLDLLRAMFGFQLDDQAVEAIMNKLFKNYKKWCTFFGRKHSLRLPQDKQEAQQRKILYMGLYLLIWGEAANVRFMPECLCYIFHNTAYELHSLLAGNVSVVTRENIRPSYGSDDESFLKKVITPIYRVIEKEAKKSNNGKAPHSAWCNYDDLNEYFRSPDCFSLGWPMRDDGEFFKSVRESKAILVDMFLRKQLAKAPGNHILWKQGHFGTYSEALIVCGHSIYWHRRQ